MKKYFQKWIFVGLIFIFTLFCVHTNNLIFSAKAEEVLLAASLSFGYEFKVIKKIKVSENVRVYAKINGMCGAEGGMKSLYVNHDGNKVAYIAVEKNEPYNEFIMVNNEKISDISLSSYTDLVFSPDGSKVAYVGSEGNYPKGKAFVMINDKKVSPDFYENAVLDELVFSPDSSKVAYRIVTKKDGKYSLMINNKKIFSIYGCSCIRDTVFSHDGTKVVYIIEVNDAKEFVMVNNKKVSPEFDILFGAADSVTHCIGKFNTTQLKKTGKVFVAGYDEKKHEILIMSVDLK